MKIIAGLGNPGARYRNTRHNIGFMVADLLAERWRTAFDREKHDSLIAETRIDGERVLLVKPMTYMNNSGLALAQVLRNAPVTPDDVLVVVDEVDLPLGRVRLRAGGSAGGHNGLKSIIRSLGTQDFPRLRIGVGRDSAGGDVVDHVLGTFTPAEFDERDRMVERAADAAAAWIARGITAAMNDFN